MNPQQEQVLKFAETMMKMVKASPDDHVKIKEAVVAFIEAMDTHATLLGDSDLARIAYRAMERRGKSIGVFSALVQSAKAGK